MEGNGKLEQKLQIYPKRENRLNYELKKLGNWKISAKNKELINKFLNYLLSTSSKSLRVSKLCSQLRRICLKLDKDLDKAAKDDIQDVVAYYNQVEEYSEATKSDYRRTIRQFYKWYENEDNRLESEDKSVRIEVQKFYKYIKNEIRTSYKIPKADPKTILTDEDIEIVLEKGCKTIKEKALIKFLHEAGVRAGELLNMRIADIEFNKDYAMARVDGKTGERHIPIVTSVPYLVRYLELHPFRNDNFSFLWLSDNRRNLNEPLLHTGARKIVERCFERAGLNHKKHNLHWFREL